MSCSLWSFNWIKAITFILQCFWKKKKKRKNTKAAHKLLHSNLSEIHNWLLVYVNISGNVFVTSFVVEFSKKLDFNYFAPWQYVVSNNMIHIFYIIVLLKYSIFLSVGEISGLCWDTLDPSNKYMYFHFLWHIYPGLYQNHL